MYLLTRSLVDGTLADKELNGYGLTGEGQSSTKGLCETSIHAYYATVSTRQYAKCMLIAFIETSRRRSVD